MIRSIARIDRLDSLSGEGVQREEIRNHVREIAEGIRAGTDIPNPVLLVFDPELFAEEPQEDVPESFIVLRAFTDEVSISSPVDPSATIQSLRTVEFDIPYRPAAFDEEKAISLVDGQQRTAALSLVDVDDFPVVPLSVVGVVGTSDEARRVFQVANNTHKISTQFSRALLANMGLAPGYLKEEQKLAKASRVLCLDDQDSPFYNMVKYLGADVPNSPIVYNSLFKVVSTFAEQLPGMDDESKIVSVVKKSFNFVRDTWPEAWGVRPSPTARLTHGAGLRAVAAMSVRVLQGSLRQHHDLDAPAVWDDLHESLRRLRTRVVWTQEEAGNGSRVQRTNWQREIQTKQNTNQDIEALTNFLIRESLALEQ